MQPARRHDRTAPALHPRLQLPHPRELGRHLVGLLRPEPDPQADAAADARIRQILHTLTPDRLREAGLLDQILACADPLTPDPGPHPADPDPDMGADELSDLDLEALVDLALDER